LPNSRATLIAAMSCSLTELTALAADFSVSLDSSLPVLGNCLQCGLYSLLFGLEGGRLCLQLFGLLRQFIPLGGSDPAGGLQGAVLFQGIGQPVSQPFS